jgi:hypothetical protein
MDAETEVLDREVFLGSGSKTGEKHSWWRAFYRVQEGRYTSEILKSIST